MLHVPLYTDLQTTIKPCQETSYACMLYSINTKTSQPKIVCQSFGLVNIIISPKLCATLVQSIYMHYTHISIRDRMAEWSRALTSDMGLFPKEQDGRMVWPLTWVCSLSPTSSDKASRHLPQSRGFTDQLIIINLYWLCYQRKSGSHDKHK